MYFIELPINSLRDGESHILQFARKLASAAYGKKSGEDGNLKKPVRLVIGLTSSLVNFCIKNTKMILEGRRRKVFQLCRLAVGTDFLGGRPLLEKVY